MQIVTHVPETVVLCGNFVTLLSIPSPFHFRVTIPIPIALQELYRIYTYPRG